MTTPKHHLIGEDVDDTLHNFYEEVLDEAYDLKHSKVQGRKLMGYGHCVEGSCNFRASGGAMKFPAPVAGFSLPE